MTEGLGVELTARALRRDDLLMTAHDAEIAIGIVDLGDRDFRMESDPDEAEYFRFRSPADEADLFRLALTRHLAAAQRQQGSDGDFARAAHLAHAAAVLSFCRLVNLSVQPAIDPSGLYAKALEAIAAPPSDHDHTMALPRDPNRHMRIFYPAVRELRLGGFLEAAELLAAQDDDFYHATGAGQYRGYIDYEKGASYLRSGEAEEGLRALSEAEEFWQNRPGPVWASRHRTDLVLGLLYWNRGEADTAMHRLERAYDRLTTSPSETFDQVHRLSLTLTLAEAVHARYGETKAARAAELLDGALKVANSIRSRWRVVARSSGPLSLIVQRIYGDIALGAVALPQAQGAELGLRTALSAKQTAFAKRIRAGRPLTNKRVRKLIEEILREERNEPGTQADSPAAREANLKRLRRELNRRFSPMLAETVIPTSADVKRIASVLGARYAIDLVALPCTASKGTCWFRTLLEPGGTISHERFVPGPATTEFFSRLDPDESLWHNLKELDWEKIGAEILPARLIDRLRRADRNFPLDLVVSGHSELSLLPWPALKVDGDGTRLLELAIITQTPVLTCIATPAVPAVGGEALLRLVSKAEGGVLIDNELYSWDQDRNTAVLPLSSGHIGEGVVVLDTLNEDFSTALSRPNPRWNLAHLAAHGGGTGLEQHLLFPNATPASDTGTLTAGHALGLKWPESVLIGSCEVGKVVNLIDSEPLGFVVAILMGGGKCVVAGIDRVPDLITGWIAQSIVLDVRRSGRRLDVALRDGQMKVLDAGRREHEWALLAAFIR